MSSPDLRGWIRNHNRKKKTFATICKKIEISKKFLFDRFQNADKETKAKDALHIIRNAICSGGKFFVLSISYSGASPAVVFSGQICFLFGTAESVLTMLRKTL